MTQFKKKLLSVICGLFVVIFIFMMVNTEVKSQSLSKPASARINSNIPRLRVATFNLRYHQPGERRHKWEERRKIAEILIRNESPDIIAFQEIYTWHRNGGSGNFQLHWLNSTFPQYELITPQKTPSQDSSLPILYLKNRFRLVDHGSFTFAPPGTDEGPFQGWYSSYYCNWIIVEEIVAGLQIMILNIHIPPAFMSLGGEGPRKYRKGAAEAVLNHIERMDDDDLPVVVLGDFNAFPGSKPVKKLLSSGFAPSLNGAYPGTYHGFNGKVVIPRIDHILYSGDLALANSWVSRIKGEEGYPSDHFPLLADLIYD